MENCDICKAPLTENEPKDENITEYICPTHGIRFTHDWTIDRL